MTSSSSQVEPTKQKKRIHYNPSNVSLNSFHNNEAYKTGKKTGMPTSILVALGVLVVACIGLGGGIIVIAQNKKAAAVTDIRPEAVSTLNGNNQLEAAQKQVSKPSEKLIQPASNVIVTSEQKNDAQLSQTKKINIHGLAIFKCDYSSTADAVKGMKFYKNVKNGPFITLLYGAGGTEVTIRDASNAIIGFGKADPDGSYSVLVPPCEFYQIEIKFKDKTANKTIAAKDAEESFDIDFGRLEF
jgi:hypothetical protein